MKCTMLSMDTSSSATGLSVWENGKHKKTIELNEDYYQKNEKKMKKYFRGDNNFDKMIKSFLYFIKDMDVSIIVVETPVVERNPQTQRVLDRIVGFIQGYSTVNDIDFWEYRPSEWRAFVKDEDEKLPRKRKELKEWAILKSQKLTKKKMTDNMAESYLIGLAHINYWKGLKLD